MDKDLTIAAIRRDLASYKGILKRGQKGVTIYAEKYVEDLGYLLTLLDQRRFKDVEKDYKEKKGKK